MKVLLSVVAIVLHALLLDSIEPVKTLSAGIHAHDQPWKGLCLGALGAGGTLMLITFASIVIRGRPMTDPEAREFLGRSAGSLRLRRVIRGRVAGREGSEEASFAALKQAFRSGTWLSDPGIRPFCIGLVGMMLLF